jgi:hypothetical protein
MTATLRERVMDRKPWNADRLNQVLRGYQASCVLAAELLAAHLQYGVVCDARQVDG